MCVGMRNSEEVRERINRAKEWAEGLPESAWTPGPPPSVESYCVIKTESGHMLGMKLAEGFPANIPLIPLKGKWNYGKIVAHVLVSEQNVL